MSMDYIRKMYSVPAKRGGRVRWKPILQRALQLTGTITSARGAYLRVRPDGKKRSITLHPTWNITYLPKQKEKVIA